MSGRPLGLGVLRASLQCRARDFEVLAQRNRLRILDAFGLQDGRVVRWLPNARASTAVFKFERAA